MEFAFIPNDAALPALPEFASPTHPPEAVIRAAAELSGRAPSLPAERSYVRYWPARRCVVQWTFSDGEAPTIVSSELLSEREVRKGRNGNGRYLAAEKIWVQVFPEDRILPAMARATSVEWMESRLLPAIGAEGAAVEVVSEGYKSWRRCVLRYDVGGRRYYGKLFRDDRGEDLLRVLRSIEEGMKTQDVGWTMPESLLYDSETRMLLSCELEASVTLADRVRAAGEESAAQTEVLDRVADAARALAAFQAIEVEGLERFDAGQVYAALEEDVGDIAIVEPQVAEMLNGALERLKDLKDSLPPERLAISHGAFRHSHVYESPNGLAFLDLDNVRLSGTNADAGYFLAYLAFRMLQRRRSRALLELCRETFARTWREQRSYDAGWLTFHARAVLLKWTIRAFFSLEDSWPGLMPLVNALCEDSEPMIA